MQLARKFNVVTHEFDHVYWDMSGTEFVKNSDASMAAAIEKIIEQESWFVEGAYDKRMYPLLVAVFIDLEVGGFV